MSYNDYKAFRQKLSSGFVLGPFAKTCDPAFIEVMGHAKLDFVVIDMEHGPHVLASIDNLIRAAQVSGVFPVVRVKENDMEIISQVLDLDAGAVMVPQVRNAVTARKVVEHARFSPKGQRGVCRFVRAAQYSAKQKEAYFRIANEAVLIVQVEGIEAIKNLDEILDVDWIDVVFVGPYDLSQALGIPGQIDHPKVEEQMQQIVDKCQERKVTLGTFTDTPEQLQKWKNAGVRFLSYSVDVGLFFDKCKELRINF